MGQDDICMANLGCHDGAMGIRILVFFRCHIELLFSQIP